MPSDHNTPVGAVLTEQIMFNRAWNGLKSQGWQKSREGHISVYYNHDGLRCAWGWVDPEGTEKVNRNLACLPVSTLRNFRIGLAATLTPDQLEFAKDLQKAHDNAFNSGELKRNMRRLASDYRLEVPDA